MGLDFNNFYWLRTNLLVEAPLLCVHRLHIVSSISFRSHDSSPRATNGRRITPRTKFLYIFLPAVFLESDKSFMSIIFYICVWLRDEIFMNTTVHVSFYKIMCTLKITQLKADVDYKGSQNISDVFLLSVDLLVLIMIKIVFTSSLKT